MSKFPQYFAKFRVAKFSFLQNFLFSQKFSQKFSFSRTFSQNFSRKRKFSRKFSFKGKFFVILTSILVHVYGYCRICFETLSGFDHPVGNLTYNKTAVSFVLKQDPDLLALITKKFYIVFLI
jgi:hypothetical protein